jgi:hypothetical protein
MKMHCYRATVETTNPAGDNFVVDRPYGTGEGSDYADCEGGVVYVVAESAKEAGKMLPYALKIERVGGAYQVGGE